MGTNAELVRHWFDRVWNQGDAGAIDELLAPGAVIHGLVSGRLVGVDAFRAFHGLFRAAFYDIDLKVEKVIEEGNSLTAWCRAAGTHRETGQRVAFSGAIFCEFRDGKLQEAWNCWDFLGFLVQLGVIDSEAVGVLLGT